MPAIIIFRLTLTTPLVLSVPGGDANSAMTLDYVSGSSIAGALANHWQRWRQAENPVHDEEFNAIFLSGKVIFTNAYPEGEDGCRLLPAPLSLMVEKHFSATVYDLACTNNLEDILEDNNGEPRTLLPWRPGYIKISGETLKFRTAQSTAYIHHQRDREMGRATEEKGAIFSYIALNPGEQFVTTVLVKDDQMLPTVRSLLFDNDQPLQLGRSRSAQYGGNALLEPIQETTSAVFKEAGDEAIPSGRTTVTLLSDYLGTDKTGHPTPAAFLLELSERLGLEVTSKHLVDSFDRTRPVSGYVGTWRMPQPPQATLVAGTVFVLDFPSSPPPEKIREILWNGLGRRTIEGFGRIAFNWHGKDESFTFNTDEERKPIGMAPLAPSPPGALEEDTLRLCREHLLREGIEHAIYTKANELISTSPRGIPAKAVLGRLRGRIKTAATPAEILTFLNACAPKPAGKQLQSCRIEDSPFASWLKELFTSTGAGGRLATLIAYDEIKRRWHLDGEEHCDPLFSRMEFSCQKALADQVLRGMIRMKKEMEDNNG